METDFAFISKQENIEKSAAIFFIDVAIYLMFIFFSGAIFLHFNCPLL